MTLPPFASWSGPLHPRTLIVGEAWGSDEDTTKLPFSGESGKELFRMLGEANPEIDPAEHSRVCESHKYGLAWIRQRDNWLNSASISFTNVLNFRPPSNRIPDICCKKPELPKNYPPLPALSKGLYLRSEFLPETTRLYEEITQSSPNIIVAAGNTACWALLKATNIGSIRGNTTYGVGTGLNSFKVLPTFHPASVLYQWSQRPIVVADLTKAAYESTFSQIVRPSRNILVSPTLEEWQDFVESVLSNPPPYLACDVETSAGIIDTIGFAKSASHAAVCQVGPHRYKIGTHYEYIWPQRNGTRVSSYWTHNEEIRFWQLTNQLLSSSIPKVFQNGVYDLQYLLKMGLTPQHCLEDTMLLHHSIFPEMQKSLGFLASIYTSESSWKLLRRHKADTEKRDE